MTPLLLALLLGGADGGWDVPLSGPWSDEARPIAERHVNGYRLHTPRVGPGEPMNEMPKCNLERIGYLASKGYPLGAEQRFWYCAKPGWEELEPVDGKREKVRGGKEEAEWWQFAALLRDLKEMP